MIWDMSKLKVPTQLGKPSKVTIHMEKLEKYWNLSALKSGKPKTKMAIAFVFLNSFVLLLTTIAKAKD